MAYEVNLGEKKTPRSSGAFAKRQHEMPLLKGMDASGVGGLGWIGRLARRAGRFLANFEGGEAPHGDVLAEFGNRCADHLPDGLGFVLDIVLLVQASVFVKFFHLA